MFDAARNTLEACKAATIVGNTVGDMFAAHVATLENWLALCAGIEHPFHTRCGGVELDI